LFFNKKRMATADIQTQVPYKLFRGLSNEGAIELMNAFSRRNGESRTGKSDEDFAELVGKRVFTE
jgi:hypothetical protein